MGFWSSWFGGEGSSPSGEGKPGLLRSLSDKAEKTWRREWDPGCNPRVQGSDMYDTVQGKSGGKTTWEMILEGEALRSKSFDTIDTKRDGFIDQSELAAALNRPSVDAAQLVAEADKDGDGRISGSEFDAMTENRK